MPSTSTPTEFSLGSLYRWPAVTAAQRPCWELEAHWEWCCDPKEKHPAKKHSPNAGFSDFQLNNGKHYFEIIDLLVFSETISCHHSVAKIHNGAETEEAATAGTVSYILTSENSHLCMITWCWSMLPETRTREPLQSVCIFGIHMSHFQQIWSDQTP